MKIIEFVSEDYSRWIVHVMPFLVVCGTSHNSSQLESYDHMKLENPHESYRSPQDSKCLTKEIILNGEALK